MTSTLSLVDYDPAWPARFAEEADRIAGAITTRAIAIEHVGSTAVAHLFGKPVLDIAIAVAHERDADACVEPLERLGYQYRGMNGDDPRRRYYILQRETVRVVQVHLYILPARAWDDLLTFRNALRADARLARAYAAEKRRVAAAVGWDKRAYSVAKDPFITRVLSELR